MLCYDVLTDIGAEARLGGDVSILAGQLHGDLVGDDGGAAVRDVGERARVHQHRRAFQRLHQSWLERVLQQHQEGSRHTLEIISIIICCTL
jgi:hypothetical protein